MLRIVGSAALGAAVMGLVACNTRQDIGSGAAGLDPGSADLQAFLRAPPEALVGQRLEVFPFVANAGPDEAPNVTIRVTVDGPIANLDTTFSSPGITCDRPAGNVVTCHARIAPMTREGTGVAFDVSAAGDIHIRIDGFADQNDPDPSNNSAEATIVAREAGPPDVAAELFAPRSVFVGQPLPFQAGVVDFGGPVAGAEVAISIQGAVDGVFMDPFGNLLCGSYDPATGAVLCSSGPLGTFEGAFAFFTVLPSGAGAITLRVAVSAVGDVDPTNDVSEQVVDVIQPVIADLAVALSAPSRARAGQTLNVRATVTNRGPDGSGGAFAAVRFAGEVQLVSASTPDGFCAIGFGEAFCELPALAAGASASVDVAVVPRWGGDLRVFADAYSRAMEIDPDFSNNFAVSVVSVLGQRPPAQVYTEHQIVPVSLPVFIPCANDFVLLEGNLHLSFQNMVNGGGSALSIFSANPQGVSGYGVTSGDKYQATGLTREVSRINWRLGAPYEDTFVNNFRIIGQSTGNDLLVHANIHVTIDANGVFRATVENTSFECR